MKPTHNRERDKVREAFRRFAERTNQPPHPWLKSKDKARLKGGKRAS